MKLFFEEIQLQQLKNNMWPARQRVFQHICRLCQTQP